MFHDQCVFHKWHVFVILLIFLRKDLCEAKHEMHSVLKFSDVHFELKSDVPHTRGIWWPRLELS